MRRGSYLGVEILNYRLVQKLGGGGFGDVYLAEHVELGRRAACKVLHPEFARNDDLVERFFQEARAVCAIGHRAIIDIQNFGRLPSGEPFYLMEYFAGENLSEYMSRVGAVRLELIPYIFGPIGSALAAAHEKGIVHRDLKPDNIMLREEGGHIAEVKLVDFGIAKLVDDRVSVQTQTGIGMGTPRFMAPEQARDAKLADLRSDVYSFAATLYTAIAGKPPFTHENVTDLIIAVQTEPPTPLRQVVPHAPAMLERVLAQCLAKSPADRPSSMQEAWALITAALASETTWYAAPTSGPHTPPGPYTLGQSTLGMASSELQQEPAEGFRWGWIAAGFGLVAAGVLLVFVVHNFLGDAAPAPASASAHVEPAPTTAAVAVVEPDLDGIEIIDEDDEGEKDGEGETVHPATTPADDEPAPDAPAGAPEPDAPDGERMDCSESSFTALHERRLRSAERREALERLDACRDAGAITEAFHEESRQQIGARHTRGEDQSRRMSCSVASFERVHKNPDSSRAEINSALGRLKRCHERGSINDSAYQRNQKALINRLI